MSNFWQLLITGVIFLAVLISGIVYSQWTFAALFAIIDTLALWEFYRIGRQSGYKPLSIYGTAAGLAAFVLCFMQSAGLIEPRFLLLIAPVLIPIFIVVLFGRFDNPIIAIAYTFYGLLYVALPFALVSPIAFHAGSYESIMVLGMLSLEKIR